MVDPEASPPRVLDGTAHGIDPRMRSVWALAYAAPGLVLAIGGGVVALLTDERGLALVLVVLGVLWAGAGVAWAGAIWARWRFRAWPEALELRHGVLTQHQSLVPYARIQQIDVRRGPLERSLGLSRLVLRTAAATSDASLPGVAAEHAEQLRRELCVRAGLDDVV